jgi:hypothetical protein
MLEEDQAVDRPPAKRSAAAETETIPRALIYHADGREEVRYDTIAVPMDVVPEIVYVQAALPVVGVAGRILR